MGRNHYAVRFCAGKCLGRPSITTSSTLPEVQVQIAIGSLASIRLGACSICSSIQARRMPSRRVPAIIGYEMHRNR
jgi:hypothetical protein